MKKLFHGSKYIHNTYENGFNILQSDGKDKYYDLSEVEIFKIIIKWIIWVWSVIQKKND